MPTTITCPSCGAGQPLPDNSPEVSCAFCGTRFSVGDTAQAFPQPELSDLSIPDPLATTYVDQPKVEGQPYQSPSSFPQASAAQPDYYPADKVEVLSSSSARPPAKKTSPATWIAIAVLILLSLCLVCGCLGLVLSQVSSSGQY